MELKVKNTRGAKRAPQRQGKKGFIPLHFPDIGRQELLAISRVAKSGWLTRGRLTEKFEEKFASFIGAKYALAVSSCTSAIELALRAIGVSKGDEVIMSPLSFVSPANAVVRLGATPIFVDVRMDTFCIDEEKLEGAITSRTKAIICVHFGGSLCNMERILRISAKSSIFVIEDCAHALPASLKGKSAGSFGDFACFSFYPTKGITTFEGGMLVARKNRHIELARKWHLHGMTGVTIRRTFAPSVAYDIVLPGIKANFTDVQSAVGIVQLKKAEKWRKKRAQIAKMYTQAFSDVPEIKLQKNLEGCESAHHLFPIVLWDDRLAKSRDRIVSRLAEDGIQCGVHYKPIHLFSFYRKKFGHRRGEFPVAERLSSGEISLPIYHLMDESCVNRVIEAVRRAIRPI